MGHTAINSAAALVWGMVGAAVIAVAAVTAGIGRPEPGPLFATVDEAGLVQAQRDRILLKAKDMDETQMARSMKDLEAYGERLERAVRDVSQRHQAVLISKQAVIAGRLPDLTHEVQAQLAGGE